MPQLKQLSCCVQWADTGAPFQEHGTVYGDGVVESFIIVPNKPQGFSIRLTSRGFICEGLVMIVFIDGNYQCNRTRVNLLPPANDRPVNRTEINFLLRQKEKSQGDGIYLGREWRFDNHNIVAKTPEGFQESHFDDLGVIEVLVLRCRARNQEDADYEGSSSGEDSDVFGERPLIEDQQEPSATSGQATAVAEEDGGLGLMGIFDGANDPPGIPPNDAGHNAPPGRWIWHQSHPPFPGVPEPPQYHQPEGYRVRSQSYARPPATPHPQPHYDRRSYSGQPERRVHFDDWHTGRHHQQDMHRAYPQIHQPQPYRPVSRVRERWPSNGSQTYPTQSYEPQRIDPPSQRTEWHDAQETQDQRQSSGPPHRGERLGHDDGNAQKNNANGRVASYSERPSNYSQSQPSQGRRNANGQQPEHRQSFTARQNSSEPATNANSGPSSIGITNNTSPTQDTTSNAQSIPLGDSSAQSHRPSQPEPIFFAPRPEYSQHVESSNQAPHHSVSSSHTSAAPYQPYPHPHSHPQMPYGYHYPQTPHPGYWPMPLPYPYGPSHPHVHPGQAAVTMYPPHMVHPGREELISPTNIHGNMSGCPDLNGGPTSKGYGEPHNGQQGASNGGDISQSWLNSQPNDSNSNNQNNGNNNAKDKIEDQRANNEEVADDNHNQENTAAGDPNDNTNQDNTEWNNNEAGGNADSNGSGNDNDAWGNDNGGNNGNGWDTNDSGANNNNNGTGSWDQGNNTPTADNAGDWDAPAANNNGTDSVESPYPSAARAGVVADIPRDLYGPHGPYYALRGLRLGEPRPDAEEEPRFDVPKSLATARGSTKQVQPGPGYRYYKKRIVPEYIDTLESPYARFVFKYRTKDQLLNEIGIEIDVEPTGDAEIQDLQNLDKQVLIEMLMRAKSALGGKVPSPPPTPAGSARGSEVNAPIAIDAPKYAYLKYSLPPLRPNLANSRKRPPSEAKSEQKQGQASSGKENNSGWDTSNNNNGGGGWDDTPNNNATAQGGWGASGWDGPPKISTPSGKSPTPSAKSSLNSGGSQRSQNWGASGSKKPDLPPRPPTPNNVPAQTDTAELNWDQAEKSSGGQEPQW